MEKSPIPLTTIETMFTLSPAQAAELYNRHLLDSQQVCKLPFGVRDKRLQKALTYISDHCMENLKIKTVADMVGMSVEGLKKLFERNCHKSFKTIHYEFRIAAAREMLSTTDELISNIAIDCGYSSTKSFNKTFRECCGMTAGEYRKAIDCYNRSLYQNTVAMNNLLNAPEEVYLAKREEPIHSSGRK
jgi:transcriptional regulator GlxA family with amidase domain